MKPSSSLIAEMATIEAISLSFSSLKSICRDPMGPSVAFMLGDGRDKIGIAGEKYDHHERRSQRQVDYRQIRQQDLFVAHRGECGQEVVEMQADFANQGDQADGKRQIERRQKKSAREQQALERVFDHRSLGAPEIVKRRSLR